MPQNRANESRPVLAQRSANSAHQKGTMLAGKGVKRRRLSHDADDHKSNKRPNESSKHAWRHGDGFSDFASIQSTTPTKTPGSHLSKSSFATPARPLSRSTHFARDGGTSQDINDVNAEDETPRTQRPRFLAAAQPRSYNSLANDPVTPSPSITRPRFALQASSQGFGRYSTQGSARAGSLQGIPPSSPTPSQSRTNLPSHPETNLQSHNGINSPSHPQAGSSRQLTDSIQTQPSQYNNAISSTQNRQKQQHEPDPWSISTTFSPRKHKHRFTPSGWASTVRRWILESAYARSDLSHGDHGVIVRVAGISSGGRGGLLVSEDEDGTRDSEHRDSNGRGTNNPRDMSYGGNGTFVLTGVLQDSSSSIQSDDPSNHENQPRENQPRENQYQNQQSGNQSKKINILLTSTHSNSASLHTNPDPNPTHANSTHPTTSRTPSRTAGLNPANPAEPVGSLPGKLIRLNEPLERLELSLGSSRGENHTLGGNRTIQGEEQTIQGGNRTTQGEKNTTQSEWIICAGGWTILS